jgi:hypothetical protein
LFYRPGHNAYQDFRIRNNFGGGFHEVRFHNLGDDGVRVTKLSSEVARSISRFGESQPDKLSIVDYWQNTIGVLL